MSYVVLLQITRAATMTIGMLWILIWVWRYLYDSQKTHRVRLFAAGIVCVTELLFVHRLASDSMNNVGHHMTGWSLILIIVLAIWACVDALKGNESDLTLFLIAASQLVTLGMWFAGLYWASWFVICSVGWSLILLFAVLTLRVYNRERKEARAAKAK